ncbi:hypothetical protein B9Z19DRAFT_554840 [Tuber borchii]|uniref:Uncharacterized protein n=1 Tax=Tuber borchii TaxID=42251 RepID=A0A2T6ZCP7_TUBBO|nr:hypothetical protein B9Z19DRAFT_554840 [Tuber borchii]
MVANAYFPSLVSFFGVLYLAVFSFEGGLLMVYFLYPTLYSRLSISSTECGGQIVIISKQIRIGGRAAGEDSFLVHFFSRND